MLRRVPFILMVSNELTMSWWITGGLLLRSIWSVSYQILRWWFECQINPTVFQQSYDASARWCFSKVVSWSGGVPQPGGAAARW